MVYECLKLNQRPCWLCAGLRHGPALLCSGCQKDLPYISQPGCPGCGKTLVSDKLLSQPIRCGDCQQQTLPYDQLHAAFWYRPPVNQLIQKLKFDHKLLYARLLGELWLNRLIASGFNPKPGQQLVPVPLHGQRLWGRGYNQSLELIRPTVRRFRLTVDYRVLIRIRATSAQSDLPLSKREQNVSHAFQALSQYCHGKHLILVDDVMTTGATVRAAARALRQAGADTISVLVLARTWGSGQLTP